MKTDNIITNPIALKSPETKKKEPVSFWNGRTIGIAATITLGAVAYLYKKNLDNGWFVRATTSHKQILKLIADMPNKVLTPKQISQIDKLFYHYCTSDSCSSNEQLLKPLDFFRTRQGTVIQYLINESNRLLKECENTITQECDSLIENASLSYMKEILSGVKGACDFANTYSKVPEYGNVIADLCKEHGIPIG